MPWRGVNFAPQLRLFRVGLALLPLAVAVAWGWQAWSQKRAAAIEDAGQNAALIGEYTARILQSQKLLLTQIDNIVSDTPGLDEETLHKKLRILDAGFEFTTSLGVVGADGAARAGSRSYPLVLNVGDREYFSSLRDTAIPIYVDRVVLRPMNLDTLMVARRLPGETFQGIATASTEIRNLTDFLSGLSNGVDEAAFLLRSDGKLLLRPNPNDPPAMMRPDGPVMTAIAKADSGVFDAPGYMDGIGRTYVFKKIENFPLYAIHGFSRATLLSSVLFDMLPIFGFLAVLGMLGHVALSAVMKNIEAERARQLAEFDRRQLEDARRTAALKETLLKEMNHRIHNNLQMIQALIYARSRTGGEAAETLKEIGKRIWAISEVHNLLYNTAEYSQIDLGAFLRTMANSPGIVPPERGLLVKCDTHKVEIALEQAVPAALIVLEFLTNALKHAFPGGRGGTIAISLRRLEEDEAEITVADDGIGLPLLRGRNSGMALTEILASQIEGRIDAEAGTHGGTCMRLRFPIARRPGASAVVPMTPRPVAEAALTAK